MELYNVLLSTTMQDGMNALILSQHTNLEDAKASIAIHAKEYLDDEDIDIEEFIVQGGSFVKDDDDLLIEIYIQKTDIDIK